MKKKDVLLMENQWDTEDLIREIVESAKIIRHEFPPGYEEKIYKNALLIELQERGIHVDTEVAFSVNYKGHVLGEYRADIIAEGKCIIELKAVRTIAPVHEVQLVNYLNATGIDDGLLINFGGDVIEIRRKYRLYWREK